MPVAKEDSLYVLKEYTALNLLKVSK